MPVVLYAHPFELCFAVVLLINGARAVSAGNDDPPTLTQVLPGPVVTAWQYGTIIAGLAIIGGLLARRRALARAVEKAGLYVGAGVASAYGTALLLVIGKGAGYAGGQLVAFAVGAVLRAMAIRKTERVVLQQLQAVNARTADPVALVLQLVDGRPPRDDA